jgi:hypothetical protein
MVAVAHASHSGALVVVAAEGPAAAVSWPVMSLSRRPGEFAVAGCVCQRLRFSAKLSEVAEQRAARASHNSPLSGPGARLATECGLARSMLYVYVWVALGGGGASTLILSFLPRC